MAKCDINMEGLLRVERRGSSMWSVTHKAKHIWLEKRTIRMSSPSSLQ